MHGAILAVFSATLIVGDIGVQGYGNLDTLGDDLARELEPLNHLGEKINHDVQMQVGHLHERLNRENAIRQENFKKQQEELQKSLAKQQEEWQNIGPRINTRVRNSMAGLDHLGEDIQKQVYASLEPVRALEFNFKMRDGVGGTTVVKYGAVGKTFIVKSRKRYTCSGIPSPVNGECQGILTPFIPVDKKDFCYVGGSTNIVNNRLCISTGPVSINVLNNNFSCNNMDGSPTLIIDVEDYKKMCQDVPVGLYTYYADVNNKDHVQIPHPNKYVKCENNVPNICVFRMDDIFRY